MDPTLYWIESLASISVLQLVTVAAGLPFAAEAPGADAAMDGIAAAPAVVAGAVVMGAAGVAAVAAVADGGGLVVPGAGWFDDEEWLPHAASTSEQAMTGTSIFRFIIRSPLRRGGDCRHAMLHVA